ncbi:MAG: DUF2155 domain-containing protein [Pseudomonadota bacterium]
MRILVCALAFTSFVAGFLPSGMADASQTWVQKEKATLRALDKITGRSTDIVVTVGEPVAFGSLEVGLQVCYQTPPEEAPESAAFLQVHSLKPQKTEDGIEDRPIVFSGWMFASSPGLSALEHPVYDVWVIECETPDVGPSGASPLE